MNRNNKPVIDYGYYCKYRADKISFCTYSFSYHNVHNYLVEKDGAVKYIFLKFIHVNIFPKLSFRSARSLTTSHTPTRSFVSSWKASTLNVEDVEEPLLGGSLPTRPVHLSKTKNLLCIVSFRNLFLVAFVRST